MTRGSSTSSLSSPFHHLLVATARRENTGRVAPKPQTVSCAHVQSPVMPGGKMAGKPSGKPARQLLFSEALLHPRPTSSTTGSQLTNQAHTMTDPAQEATKEHILQEITVVGRRLEEMDCAITSLTAKRDPCIAGFQSRVAGLEHRVSTMEDHINTAADRDQELLNLCSKLIDLEDRSHRDNVRLFRFPEHIEVMDIQSFLRDAVPKLTDLTFNPPLDFQRVHRLGPK
ncbi:hypothetical protein NDU88_007766 [Pleurodeles waltl]|uniref:Uncharacterized protein n=1 Tax=Pleurodeles waltl TaxID=8319 RepID=A0AAV7RVT7_PLEWA|nr:hypothetical protein NDU88_007766 [Pleurodeles waltl]